MSSFEIIKKTHFAVVTIFFLIYLLKTFLLLANKNEALQSFTKKVKVLEMIVSFLFLATGIYLMCMIPEIKPMLIIKITIVFLSIPLAVVGFKKQNKGLATLSFILILAAFGMGEMMKKNKMSIEEVAESKTDGEHITGETLYTAAKCQSCHGADGKAKLSGALDLSITSLSEDSMAKIMLQGRGMMSPINGLTPEQAKMIAFYINTNIKGK